MKEGHLYSLELLGQSYQVRSSDEERVVSAVFARLAAEVEATGRSQPGLGQKELLLVAALNLAQSLLDLEEENKLLLELLNAE